MRTIKSMALSPSKYLLYSLIAIAFIGFTVFGIKSVSNLKGSLNSSEVKLRNNQLELKNNQAELQKLNLQLEQIKTDSQKSEAEKQQKIQQLEQEKQDLEQKLQAKAEQKAKLAAAAKEALNIGTTVAYAAPIVSGSHEDWMAAAGIAPSDYSYVNYIVSHESGWNPNAVNKSSGACGLGQQLPCGKWAGAWNDPVAALVAMQGYAIARYGSWANAYSFWIANHYW